ncbi:hypothetical protein HBI56_077090 [Parastagonospora nodorum]|nr:hypothetical protein HBI09_059150 [Parastagonospora nodorum]KAH4054108.1 hypothetical protein HBH49_075940 [Parastagonospora nodorum]KAH4106418.1 hypothetical protein HBH46_069270 [Parastagonospora nodorum]KAH4192588.1 hypothetical protein HBH42_108970 [Parastagonospora nodorum]KAH4907594.1 hypothetical protein HBI80_067320 [Parastagonospora nodorum]
METIIRAVEDGAKPMRTARGCKFGDCHSPRALILYFMCGILMAVAIKVTTRQTHASAAI